MRILLRPILAIALLFGSGAGDWTPAARHACCCGESSDLEDACPCPQPEGGRTPLRGACSERQAVVTLQAVRSSQPSRRRVEPRPAPAGLPLTSDQGDAAVGAVAAPRGRDPDLGRHLASLSALRI